MSQWAELGIGGMFALMMVKEVFNFIGKRNGGALPADPNVVKSLDKVSGVLDKMSIRLVDHGYLLKTIIRELERKEPDSGRHRLQTPEGMPSSSPKGG